MFLLGIQHKGDPFYIMKHFALSGAQTNDTGTIVHEVRRFHDHEVEKIRINDQMVSIIQDILRSNLRERNKEPVKVFMATKDSVLKNVLISYFQGCVANDWTIGKNAPVWYHPFRLAFETVAVGDKITKKQLKELLTGTNDAKDTHFKRIQKTMDFSELLKEFNIEILNNRTYIKRELQKETNGVNLLSSLTVA